MFLNYLYNLPNSTSGFDAIATETIEVIPNFASYIMVFVFFIVFLGGVMRQKLKTGTADAPLWAVIASISTLLVALVLSVSSGFINLGWLAIVTVITIFSGVWLFLDRRQSEV